MTDTAYENTDKEIWRETPDDYYSPSIHTTEQNLIGINVGGHVYVKSVREWHQVATENEELKQKIADMVAERLSQYE